MAGQVLRVGWYLLLLLLISRLLVGRLLLVNDWLLLGRDIAGLCLDWSSKRTVSTLLHWLFLSECRVALAIIRASHSVETVRVLSTIFMLSRASKNTSGANHVAIIRIRIIVAIARQGARLTEHQIRRESPS
jgi:hypothetical protein